MNRSFERAAATPAALLAGGAGWASLGIASGVTGLLLLAATAVARLFALARWRRTAHRRKSRR
jgi:hypothetical protein